MQPSIHRDPSIRYRYKPFAPLHQHFERGGKLLIFITWSINWRVSNEKNQLLACRLYVPITACYL